MPQREATFIAAAACKTLHLDILSDLKRIHSHICSVAYPVLEAAGELKRDRFETSSLGAADAPVGMLPAPPART